MKINPNCVKFILTTCDNHFKTSDKCLFNFKNNKYSLPEIAHTLKYMNEQGLIRAVVQPYDDIEYVCYVSEIYQSGYDYLKETSLSYKFKNFIFNSLKFILNKIF